MEATEQAFVEAVVGAAHEPVAVLDVNHRVIAASQAFCQTFALKLEECEGHPITELADGRWDAKAMSDLLERVRHNRTHQASLVLPSDPPDRGRCRGHHRRTAFR